MAAFDAGLRHRHDKPLLRASSLNLERENQPKDPSLRRGHRDQSRPSARGDGDEARRKESAEEDSCLIRAVSVDQLGNQAKSLLIRVEGVEPPRARSRKQVKEEEEDDDDDDGVGETDEDFSSSTKSNGYSSSFQDQGLSEDRNMDLLYLAHEGRLDEMRLMLEDGADVNFADFDDRTALHVAACEGKANVVSFLIQKGANVNAKDRWGSTPLTDAVHYKNKDVCAILERHGGIRNERVPTKNPLGNLDYEINPAELEYSEKIFTKKGYRMATWRGIQVFVKCLKSDVVYSEKNLMAFRAELCIIQKLRHPNIVQFLGAVTQSTPVMLIFEYLPEGDLYEYLKKKPVKPMKAVEFALDIARGLNYMHEHKPEAIVHRDLKPKNILLDEHRRLKVADLGLSKMLKFSAQTISGDVPPLKGSSCRYMAPEVFLNKVYGRKVDVFAFGLVLQEMIEGVQPMYGMPNEKVPSAYAESKLRPPFKASSLSYPGDLKKLIKECWHEDPDARPTFAEIIVRLEKIKMKSSQNPLWKLVSHLRR